MCQISYPLQKVWGWVDIGSKCCCFSPQPQHYGPLFRQIKFFETIYFAKDVQKKFHPILFCQFRDNWGQSLSQTDGLFLLVKFATSLTRFARRGINFLLLSKFGVFIFRSSKIFSDCFLRSWWNISCQSSFKLQSGFQNYYHFTGKPSREAWWGERGGHKSSFFYYPPFSKIASFVGTVGMVMCHLHLTRPCCVALGQVLIWGLNSDWLRSFVNWVLKVLYCYIKSPT